MCRVHFIFHYQDQIIFNLTCCFVCDDDPWLFILFIYNCCWLLLSQDLYYHTQFLLFNWNVRHFTFFVLIFMLLNFFDHLLNVILCLCFCWIRRSVMNTFFCFILYTNNFFYICWKYDIQVATLWWFFCQMFVFIIFIFWTT